MEKYKIKAEESRKVLIFFLCEKSWCSTIGFSLLFFDWH